MKKIIKCMVTAGATREHLDPVRFISNPSTGKMGIAIANECSRLGWDTTLILGETLLNPHSDVKVCRVVSADDMLKACEKLFDTIDILIMTAAVSDMRPKKISTKKVKKEDLEMQIEFETTPDILKTLSKRKKNQILVGFAAETHDLEKYATKKLKEKNLDYIVANEVGKNKGFANDKNTLLILDKSMKKISLEEDSKENLSKKLLQILNKNFS